MSWSQFYQANLVWPTGGVWSNLLASLILGVPTIWLGWRRVKSHLAGHHSQLLESVEHRLREGYIAVDHALGDVLPDVEPGTDPTEGGSSDATQPRP